MEISICVYRHIIEENEEEIKIMVYRHKMEENEDEIKLRYVSIFIKKRKMKRKSRY